MKRVVVLAAAVSAFALGGSGVAETAAPMPAAPRIAVSSAAPVMPRALYGSGCTVATPTTATGYAAMFHALPVSQWGAADVSISVRVGSTVVWLFGDTISGSATGWSRFVHSTVVTQRYGCLHVSRAGAQTLPNDPDGSWYWIKSAAAIDSSHLRITADHVVRTGSGTWDFKVIGERTATAVLSGGDVTFQSWSGDPVPVQHIVQKDGGIYAPWTQTVSEIATGAVLVTGLPHSLTHWSYAPSVHQELRLASGKTLLTVCQNGTPLTYDVYRPLFFEVTL